MNPQVKAYDFTSLVQFEAFGYQFLTTTVKNREAGSIDVYWNSANGWSFLCESPLFKQICTIHKVISL